MRPNTAQSGPITTGIPAELRLRLRLAGKTAPFIFFIFAAVALPAFGQNAASHLPRITLRDPRGIPFQLGTNSGRPMLVAFLQTIPDDTDTPSRQQIACLLSLQHQYGARGLTVVAVDESVTDTAGLTSRESLVNAGYDLGLTFPLLVDTGQTLMAAARLPSIPTLLLVSSDGVVKARWSGLTLAAPIAQRIEQLLGGPLTNLPSFSGQPGNR